MKVKKEMGRKLKGSNLLAYTQHVAIRQDFFFFFFGHSQSFFLFSVFICCFLGPGMLSFFADLDTPVCVLVYRKAE